MFAESPDLAVRSRANSHSVQKRRSYNFSVIRALQFYAIAATALIEPIPVDHRRESSNTSYAHHEITHDFSEPDREYFVGLHRLRERNGASVREVRPSSASLVSAEKPRAEN